MRHLLSKIPSALRKLSSLFACFLLIPHNDRDKFFRLQVCLGNPLNILTGSFPDEIGIAVRIIQSELVKLYLRKVARQLMVGVQAESKAPCKVVFAVVELRVRNG